MNLVKEKWNEKDIQEFKQYVESLGNKDKIEWTKNIINTNLPVLAIKADVIKNISKEILKGNYESFLDFMVSDYYEFTAINGGIISKIKDFNLIKKYLNIYVTKIDNWASSDILSFNIKGNEEAFFKLLNEYIKSDKPFIRRVGIVILFNYIDYTEYLPKLFNILNSFYDEEHYYVNMINAWLVCECFIKQKDATLKFLVTHRLNKFTINKAIQKCRDSYRVTKEDKDMLLKYKVK